MAKVQVRYIVNDVDAAIKFYTEQLGFKLEMHPALAFAMLSRDELRLVLSAPNPAAGGGQPMTDGTQQTPGGWNRFAIEVTDISKIVETLRKAGVNFRNNIIKGVGGKQIIVSESFIRQNGRLGRSQGCPAVPEKDCAPIVNNIKEGSVFFIFYPDSNYFNCSSFYN